MVVNACCSHDLNENVVGVCFVGQDMTQHKMVKRPTDAKSPDCKRCEQCALRNACWNINGGGIRIGDDVS